MLNVTMYNKVTGALGAILGVNGLDELTPHFTEDMGAIPGHYLSEECYFNTNTSEVEPRVEISLPNTKAALQGDSIVVNIPEGIYVSISGETVLSEGTITINYNTLHQGSIDLVGKYIGSISLEWINLTVAKNNKWNEVKAIRDIALTKANTVYGVFDSDPISRANILGAVSELSKTEDTTLETSWKMADNTIKKFSTTEFIEASAQVTAHISSVYSKSWKLESDINNATNLEDLEALDWDNIAD
jgi:hypothetical protein